MGNYFLKLNHKNKRNEKNKLNRNGKIVYWQQK